MRRSFPLRLPRILLSVLLSVISSFLAVGQTGGDQKIGDGKPMWVGPPVSSGGVIEWDLRLRRSGELTRVEVLDEDNQLGASSFRRRDDIVAAGDSKTEIFFLIDTSDRTNRVLDVQRSREIVRDLMVTAKPHHRFGLGILGERMRTINKLGSSVEDILKALDRKENFTPQSHTYLYRSLIETINAFPNDPVNRRAIVVFTDGIAEDGGEAADTASDAIAAARKNGVAFLTVALERDPRFAGQAKALGKLAEATAAPSLHLKKASGYQLGSDVKKRLLDHLDAGGVISMPEGQGGKGLRVKLTMNDGEVHLGPLPADEVAAQVDPKPETPVEPETPVDPIVPEDGEPGEPESEGTPGDDGEMENDGDKPENSDAGDNGGADEAESDKEKDAGKKKTEASKSGEKDWKEILKENWILASSVGAGFLLFIIWLIVAMSKKSSREEAEFDTSMPPTTMPPTTAPGFTALGSSPPAMPTLRSGTFLEDVQETENVYPIIGTAVRIGRGVDNDIRLENDSVSKHHASIHKATDGRFVVQDLASGNGIFVNGNRVDSAELKPGDVIEFGEVHLKFTVR